MKDVDKSMKHKKRSSVVLLAFAIIACAILGFLTISVFQTRQTVDDAPENALSFILSMLIFFIPILIAFFIGLICDVSSILIQLRLKEHRSIIVFVLSIIVLLAIIAFAVLFGSVFIS